MMSDSNSVFKSVPWVMSAVSALFKVFAMSIELFREFSVCPAVAFDASRFFLLASAVLTAASSWLLSAVPWVMSVSSPCFNSSAFFTSAANVCSVCSFFATFSVISVCALRMSAFT